MAQRCQLRSTSDSDFWDYFQLPDEETLNRRNGLVACAKVRSGIFISKQGRELFLCLECTIEAMESHPDCVTSLYTRHAFVELSKLNRTTRSSKYFIQRFCERCNAPLFVLSKPSECFMCTLVLNEAETLLGNPLIERLLKAAEVEITAPHHFGFHHNTYLRLYSPISMSLLLQYSMKITEIFKL